MTRRLLLSALLAASLLVAFEAGRASASRSATSSIPAPAPHGEPDPSLPFPTPLPVIPRGPSATVAASVPGQIRGTASWGYGWAGVVTRLPRGTRICVTGPLGRWCGRSIGYGPARWTHRIADLSRSVFAAICGAPSMGLCRVVVTW